MTDEEYFSFFADGRFYVHSTNFFKRFGYPGSTETIMENAPCYLRALTDGFLIPKVIGVARGNKTMAGQATPESTVCFDNEEQYYQYGKLNGDNYLHLSYSLNQDQPNCVSPQVMLIAPARLLEVHSVRNPRRGDWLDGKKMGIGEGTHFGSEEANVNDNSHEISLALFVQLLPDIEVSYNFAIKCLEELTRNYSFSQDTSESIESWVAKLNAEIAKDTRGYGLKVKLREFIGDFFGQMRANGFATPRTWFYPVEKAGASSLDDKEMREAIGTFLKEKHIPRPADDKREELSAFDLNRNPQERFRIEEKRLESVADQVKRKLKQHAKVPVPA